jgi:hypothetical protein
MNLLSDLNIFPPWLLILITLLFLSSLVLLIFKSWQEGREISFWPPRIGARPVSSKPHSTEPFLLEGKTPHLKLFDLSSEEERAAFENELALSIKNAKNEIYRSGRGFLHLRRTDESYLPDLLYATESALKQGVKIARIQTLNRANREWADPFADLMDKYPTNLKVYSDFSSPVLVNIGLIDPHGENPIVQLLFEAHEHTADEETYVSAAALFIYNQHRLARSIQRQFVMRVSDLDRMASDDMRRLSFSHFYFAFGSNLSTEQMRRRCPCAKVVGTAILYDWKLRFSVCAPHLGGRATAGIFQSSNDYVWGVVYSLNQEDKEKLDRIEQGGYVPVEVNVKIEHEQKHIDVFTYIPTESIIAPSESLQPDPNYLKVMEEGAKEHRIEELVHLLEELG